MISCEFENGFKVKLRHVVVDTILVKDSKILLVKRAARLIEGGKWTLPGGYMDRDETASEAAKRELMEESGWIATELALFRLIDNPNRKGENNQNVSLIFIAKPVQQTGISDDETDAVRWFDLTDLPPIDQIAFDHAENIELYKKYLKKPFDLPTVG